MGRGGLVGWLVVGDGGGGGGGGEGGGIGCDSDRWGCNRESLMNTFWCVGLCVSGVSVVNRVSRCGSDSFTVEVMKYGMGFDRA